MYLTHHSYCCSAAVYPRRVSLAALWWLCGRLLPRARATSIFLYESCDMNRRGCCRASSLFRQRKLFDGARHAIRRHTGYLCRIATILNTCSYFHIILVRKHGLYAAASNSDACQGCLSRAFGSFYFASNFHPLFLHLKLFTNIFFYK